MTPPKIIYIISNLTGITYTLIILRKKKILSIEEAEQHYINSLRALFQEIYDNDSEGFIHEILEYQTKNFKDEIFRSEIKHWIDAHNSLITDPEGKINYEEISLQ